MVPSSTATALAHSRLRGFAPVLWSKKRHPMWRARVTAKPGARSSSCSMQESVASA
jgi:hypothetical protein